MIGGPNDLFVTGQLLHFGWLVIASPYATQPSLAAGRDLKTVAVDAFDRSIIRHQEIAVVDVTNDHACLMDEVEGTRHILRCPHKKSPIGLGKLLEPQLRNVKIEDRSMSFYLRHQEANELTLFAQRVSWPRAEAMQPLIGYVQHSRDLRAIVALAGQIYLCRQVVAATDIEDHRLTASSDQVGELNLLTSTINQPGHCSILDQDRYHQRLVIIGSHVDVIALEIGRQGLRRFAVCFRCAEPIENGAQRRSMHTARRLMEDESFETIGEDGELAHNRFDT